MPYDFVHANEYDDEQYALKVHADDNQWAQDWDVYTKKDVDSYGEPASAYRNQKGVKKLVSASTKPQQEWASTIWQVSFWKMAWAASWMCHIEMK